MIFFELGISLFLTIIVYLLFPIIYVKVNGKVPIQHAKKLALINSIVCAILFCVVRAIISGVQTIITSFAPAVFYYYITKSILANKSVKNNSQTETKCAENLEINNQAELYESNMNEKSTFSFYESQSTTNEQNDNVLQDVKEDKQSDTYQDKQEIDNLNLHPLNKTRKIKFNKYVFLSIICSVLVICSVGIGLYFYLKPSKNLYEYYYSDKFNSLSTKDQLIKILSNEGTYDPSTNIVALTKEDFSNETTYSFQIMYIYDTDEIEIALTSYYKSINISTFFILDQASINQSLYFMIIDGNDAVALGTTSVRAPTFYNDISLKFDEYVGKILESDVASIALNGACKLITIVNSMLQNYNFSMQKFGFIRFNSE